MTSEVERIPQKLQPRLLVRMSQLVKATEFVDIFIDLHSGWSNWPPSDSFIAIGTVFE